MAFGGLVYFQKVSGYSGDTVAQGHKLTPEHIDNNFYYLKSEDIKDIYLVSGSTLLFERWDSDQNIELKLPFSQYFTHEEHEVYRKKLEIWITSALTSMEAYVDASVLEMSAMTINVVAEVGKEVFAKVEDLSGATKANLEALRDDFEDFKECVDGKLSGFSQEITEFEELTGEQIAVLVSQFSTFKNEVTALIKEAKEEMKAEQAKYEKSMDKKFKDFTDIAHGLLDDMQKQINEKYAEIHFRIDYVRQELLDKIDDLEERIDNIISATTEPIYEKINELSAGTLGELYVVSSELTKYVDNNVTALSTDFNTKINSLRTQVVDNKIDIETKLSYESRDIRNVITNLEDTLSLRIVDLSACTVEEINRVSTKLTKDINDVKTAHDSDIARLNSLIATMHDENIKLEQRLTARVSNVETEFVELSANTAAAIEEIQKVKTFNVELKLVDDDANYGKSFGSGIYQKGSKVTIFAKNTDDGIFVGWEDGFNVCANEPDLNTENPREITIRGDKTMKAMFRKKVGVTLLNNSTHGELKLKYLEEDNITNKEEITYYIGQGMDVTIEFIEDTPGRFKQWSDGNTDNPRRLVVEDDITLTAEESL